MKYRFVAPCCLLFGSMLLGSAANALTFSVNGSWPDQARRDAAVSAAQSAIARYNAYGNFNNIQSHVDIYYNSGIPTAQASFGGDIGFGGTWPAERVMMHEMAHFLGLPNWSSGGWSGTDSGMMAGGVWRGAIANQLVQQFDGKGAGINGDAHHFWPYGLNYDSEGSEINKQRQVAIVYAMRADLGIGPASHPSTATNVALTASDPLGTSGFNYQDRWSDGYFAHSGASYSTGDYLLRTPTGGNSFNFAGDALIINNTNGITGGLLFKGSGASATTTINNFTLDGGYVRHASGANDLFQLAGSMTLSQSPTIDAAQGNIKVLAPITGAGSLNLRGHSSFTVSLTNLNNSYAGPTVVENVTLDLEGATGYGQTTIKGGAVLVGDGRVRGDLLAESGAAVQVGGAGVSPGYTHTLIDDFEGYDLGNVRDVASPPWIAHGNTMFAGIEDDSDNRVLTYGWQDTFRGVSRDIPGNVSFAEGETATFFFRINAKTANLDHSFGLADQATTTDTIFGDFEAQLRLKADVTPGVFAVDARNGGGFSPTLASGLAVDTWYNVWMVVDQASDTYDLYLNTGDADAVMGDKLNTSPLSFRNGTTAPLSKVLGIGSSNPDNGVRVDDLYYQPGVDLTNPLLEDPALLGETLIVGGDLTLQAGATLAIDLAETVNDSVEVSGAANLSGVLAVTLDPAYTPELNDSFTVLTATNIANNLTLGGPHGSLFSLAKSTGSELILTAVSGLDGDYNNDGMVNLADYTLWRNNLGASANALLNDPDGGVIGVNQYLTWKAHFGTTHNSPRIASAAVPEPRGAWLLSVAIAGGLLRRRHPPLL